MIALLRCRRLAGHRQERPEETLAGSSNQDLVAKFIQLADVLEELPVLVLVLGEAQAWIHNDLLRCDACRVELVADALELFDDFVNHIAVVGKAVHGLGVAPAMGQDIGHFGACNEFGHLRFEAQPETSLMIAAPASTAAAAVDACVVSMLTSAPAFTSA
ncbi:hypothetical protein AHiyo1_29580 [Arthrobacter sp. Hiyo1]|nr:hypothetical protein AHiyo1_29580 [Arthrobacter sp. Hiyo1]